MLVWRRRRGTAGARSLTVASYLPVARCAVQRCSPHTHTHATYALPKAAKSTCRRSMFAGRRPAPQLLARLRSGASYLACCCWAGACRLFVAAGIAQGKWLLTDYWRRRAEGLGISRPACWPSTLPHAYTCLDTAMGAGEGSTALFLLDAGFLEASSRKPGLWITS